MQREKTKKVARRVKKQVEAKRKLERQEGFPGGTISHRQGYSISSDDNEKP